ncbi:hypothetical protein WYH_03321 (plasmid) [Croceibacterium atlanticum]|uniref:SbsA Ig-like domain-containing protein n=2 Tax=Croceibacterium atlanticum TaxID=1267766 RepID=A0A0F7KZR0_9SPHN|nr:hypothetical protein WYH_03321 [Croceibacterium atlanticum]
MLGPDRHGLGALLFICGLLVHLLAFSPAAGAQGRDPNAPYRDSYDVLHGDRLVGSWSGSVAGSSVSQKDGQMEGQAVFVRRGYRDSDYFGIVLHDHRHRVGDTFSEIHIGTIPCGPGRRRIDAVHGLEAANMRGSFATVSFDNRLGATNDSSLQLFPVYGAEARRPATITAEWDEDSFTLHLSGTFVSVVTPVANQTFDYDRQREGRLEELQLDAVFTLERTPETEEVFDLTLCEEKEFLQVVETEPEGGRENVVLEGAHFYIEFDAPIETATLNETTVFMTTRNSGGGPIFVATDLSLVASDRVRISPTEPLLGGTVYDIEVMSGEDGLRGLEEEMLASDFRFSISTLVEPEQLRLEIHQVSRDAPLVKGKPAAGRIFVEWEERDDVHPSWQVLNYPVLAEITDLDDNPVFPEIADRARRPDVISDEERRLGEHSLNLFGWTPGSGSLPMHFTARVKPANPYPETAEPEPATVDHTMQYAAEHSDLLVFDYYLAEHAEWADGADERAKHYALLAAQQQQTYMNQIFPVARVVGRYQGSYNIARPICELPDALDWVFCDQDAGNLSALLRLFHEHVSARSVAHVIVSYHPPSLGGSGKTSVPFDQPSTLIARPGETGKAHLPAPDLASLRLPGVENRNVIVMSSSPLPSGVIPGFVTAPLIEHEFGHVFALPHTPFVDDGAHRAEVCNSLRNAKVPGIDGMRIALDGTTGWQKSSEFGNAQSGGPMRNLMFPCAYDHRDEYWIDADQYEWLVKRMPAILRNAGAHTGSLSSLDRRHYALPGQTGDEVFTSVTFDEGASNGQRWIMVSGVSDGTRAQFLPAVGVPGPRDPVSGAGPFELRVEDADGQLLALAPVGPAANDEIIWPFSATVAVTGEPARIILRNGDEILAESRALPELASPVVTSHAPGSAFRAGDRLEWEAGENADGGLAYSVRFSPDGRTWSDLAIFLAETGFTPDAQTLMPGEGAAFQIIAHDGVAERVTLLPVQVEIPLTPLVSWPSEGGQSGQDSSAGVAFNVAIDPASLDAVSIQADGAPVPARISLSPSGNILTIAPRDPVPGRAYTAIIGTGLRALDGRRLEREIRLEFAPDAGAEAEAPQPWAADRPALGSASGGDSPQPVPEQGRQPPRADDVAATGDGEITLEVGSNPTIPAKITRCELDNGGALRGLGIVFETNPGSRLEIRMQQAGGTITAELSRSDGYDVSNSGSTGGWEMQLDQEGQISARGKVGFGGDVAGFSVTGQCPAQP